MIIKNQENILGKDRLNEIAQILLKAIYRLKARQEGLPSSINQLDSDFCSSTDNAGNINHQHSGHE